MKNPLRSECNEGPWVLLSDAPKQSGFAGIHHGTRVAMMRVAEFLSSSGFATDVAVVTIDEYREVAQ